MPGSWVRVPPLLLIATWVAPAQVVSDVWHYPVALVGRMMDPISGLIAQHWDVIYAAPFVAIPLVLAGLTVGYLWGRRTKTDAAILAAWIQPIVNPTPAPSV